MTTRKGKRATKAEEPETSETDALSDAMTKALDAARLADDAADDIEAIRTENEKVVEKVQSTSKKLTALSLGAFAGAAVAMTLSGLVYFRSVGDLRENAELQAQLLAELLSQTAALEEVVVQAGNQQGTIVREINAEVREVRDRLSTEIATVATDVAGYAAEMAGFQPQMASGMNDEMSGQIGTMRDDIMGAIADLELTLTGMVQASASGMPPETMAELTTLVGELRVAMAEAQTAAAMATRNATQSSSTSSNASRSTSSSSGSSRPAARPAATRAAPEPNPFSFP